MPGRQGRRVILIGLFFVLAGSARAEPPTPGAKNAETEKKRNLPIPGVVAPRATAPDAKEPEVTVRLLDQRESGWDLAETDHFRIYHTNQPGLARKSAVAAERARTAAYHKWFTDHCPDWDRRCQILIYSTARDYSNATGTPVRSPGHSEICVEGSSVMLRRIYLHADVGGMIEAVLPHEVTHTVLAGQFGDQQVPRWADEGMAVLVEPQDRIDHHLRTLVRQRDEGRLFTARELIDLKDYPEPWRIAAFYAQSVSLAQFLARAKGPRVLSRFVRDGLRDGHETSLQRHYGWNFDELERKWRKHAFSE